MTANRSGNNRIAATYQVQEAYSIRPDQMLLGTDATLMQGTSVGSSEQDRQSGFISSRINKQEIETRQSGKFQVFMMKPKQASIKAQQNLGNRQNIRFEENEAEMNELTNLQIRQGTAPLNTLNPFDRRVEHNNSSQGNHSNSAKGVSKKVSQSINANKKGAKKKIQRKL